MKCLNRDQRYSFSFKLRQYSTLGEAAGKVAELSKQAAEQQILLAEKQAWAYPRPLFGLT
jgi:hypothetical protein